MALTIAGDLTFNPMKDTLQNAAGQSVMLDEPKGDELPASGFDVKDNGYVAPDRTLPARWRSPPVRIACNGWSLLPRGTGTTLPICGC